MHLWNFYQVYTIFQRNASSLGECKCLPYFVYINLNFIHSVINSSKYVLYKIRKRSEEEKARDESKNIKLTETVQDSPKIKHRIIICTKNTGSWLTAHGATVTGTVLPGMEIFEFLCSCFNLTPPQGSVTRVLLQQPTKIALSLRVEVGSQG